MASRETRLSEDGVGGSLLASVRRKAGSLGGPVFFLGQTLVNGTNFGFHLIFSRTLGPRSYGSLGALLSITLVCAVPLSAMQLSFARARAQDPEAGGLRELCRSSARVGLLVAGVAAIVSPLLVAFLKLDGVTSALLLACWLGAATASAGPEGLLLGRQRFADAALGAVLGTGVARLALGAAAAAAGLGVAGAMGATALGQVIAGGIFLLRLRPEFDLGARQLRVSRADGLLSTVSLVGLSILGAGDTVLARHLFGGVQAGLYSAAATAGRIALFVPGAIALVTFPRFSSEGQSPRRLLGRSLALVAGLGGAVAVILALVPGPIVSVLFGSRYASSADLIRLLAVSGALLGCLNLCVLYEIARGSKLALVSWPAFVVLVVGAECLTDTAHGLAVLALVVVAVATAVAVAKALLTPVGPGE